VTDEDRERWDARHAAAEDVVPLPPDAVRGHEDWVPTAGRALDVACGRGAVALWLARRGLVVDAVDVSPVGLAAGASRAAELPVRWIRHDLDAGLPDTGPYDVVVVQRFRAPGLYPALAGVLAPGGLLVVTVLSEVDEGPGPFRAAPGGVRGPRGARAPGGGRGGEPGGTAQGCSRLATAAATAVVIGTEATSPMLPTSVRTTSVATSCVVTTSPRLRPETLKINMSGSEAPA
jgi:SAM-dependent methyltransferase